MTESLIGQQIGRYRLLEQTGSSEVSHVFKAYDSRLERTVTLKLVVNFKEYSQEFIDYFLRETRALAQLSHPNIVKILDFGQDRGYLYVVMEYVEGETLAGRMQGRKAMDWREAAQIVLPLIAALDHAHQHSVVHRDLKPSNILIDADDQPRLSDFAIARIVEEEVTRDVTGTTVGLGSPFYMSPEQGKGLAVDYRADIYAIGVILYEMVTGQKPFSAESGMEVVIQQVSAQPPSPRKFVPDLPEPVEQVLLTALKKDREERFQSMNELAAALKEILDSGKYQPKPRRGRSLSPVAGVGLALTGLALLAVLYTGAWFAGFIRTTGYDEKPAPAGDVSPTAILPQNITATAITAKPSATPIALVASATPTRAPSPTAAPRFALYPLIEGYSLPDLPGSALEPDNLGSLTELARWGVPKVNSLEWTRDGKYLVAGTSAGVYLLNAATLKPELFFDAGGWITTTVLTEDERWIATGDRRGNVRVWDFTNGALQAEFTESHTGTVTSLDFSPDARWLVSAAQDGRSIRWDMDGVEEPKELDRRAYPVTAVSFLPEPDGSLVAVGGEDFHTVLWNVETGKKVEDYANQKAVLDIVVTGTGRTLVAAIKEPFIEVWNIQPKKKERVIGPQNTPIWVTALSVSPSSQLVAAGSNDGQVRIWNILSGTLQDTLPAGSAKDTVIKVGFSYGGKHLFSLTEAGKLTVWSLDTRAPTVENEMPWKEVRRVELSPDNKTLIYQAGLDQIVRWQVAGGTRQDTANVTLPRGDTISPDSTYLVAYDGSQGLLFPLNQRGLAQSKTLAGFPLNATVSFVEESKILAAATSTGIQLWATASGRRLSDENYRYMNRCRAAYSDDGAFLAAGSASGIFLNEAAAAGYCKVDRDPRAQDEAFVQNGQFLAYGLDIGQVKLVSGQMEWLNAGAGKISAVAISPDERLLASGGDDGIVRIWDIAGRVVIKILDHHNGPVLDLNFSSDGSLLVTASADGTVQVWGIAP